MSSLSTLTGGGEVSALIGAGGLFREVTDGSRHPYVIPTLYTINNRSNSWAYNWANSDNIWTNYYAYMNSYNDQIRTPWVALGAWKANTLTASNFEPRTIKLIQYALEGTAGGNSNHETISNNSSYGPIGFRTIFIRNFHPTTAKTITLWGSISSYWSSGHDGASLLAVDPNTNSYNTGGCVYTTMWNYTGSTGNVTFSANYTIQPNRTVMFILQNTMYLWQTGYSYRWFDYNRFYNLNGTFTDGWIQPDIRMTYTASTMNDFDYGDITQNSAHRIWNRAAELYGNR